MKRDMGANLRTGIKRIGWAAALFLTFPWAVLAAFGRFGAGFAFFAQALSLAPGLPGSYLRVAYYAMTLRSCVMGLTNIGDRTQIASGVQIVSGRRQHGRSQDGRIEGAETGMFEVIPIGADCWVGAGAIVMAEIGEGATIGAGSVVTRPIPARSVAVGNPAKVIKSTVEA
jgi:acetyltransferase-like isoleucine patch superfamily enzyme